MSKTYKLSNLAFALGGEENFRKGLRPLHELRTGGVFVAVEALNMKWRLEYGVDSKMLCPPGGNVDTPVLPPAFTERELLQFLTIRSDIAVELDCFYTNDKPKPAPKPDDGMPYPLDEPALAEMDGMIPEFAAMLRRLLSKGGKWWVDDPGQLDISESAADEVFHSLALGAAIEAHMPASSAPANAPEARQPVQAVPRFAAQERAVLDCLLSFNVNPKALPVRVAGKPGIKTEAKKALKGTSLFVSDKIFDKAWERLRAAGQIQDSR